MRTQLAVHRVTRLRRSYAEATRRLGVWLLEIDTAVARADARAHHFVNNVPH